MQHRNFRGCLLVALICVAHSFHHGQILRNFLSYRIETCDFKPKTGTFATSSASEDVSIPPDEDICSMKRLELLDAIDLYNTNVKAAWLTEDPSVKKKKPKGFLGAETRGAETIPINEEGQRIIELIEALAKYNPTAVPLKGFLGYKEVLATPGVFGSGDQNSPNLGGTWKLRFTTATDATFKPGKRGPATTLQYVNATLGTFTNIIEFRENPGKVKGFQVVVEGNPVSDTKMDLTFRRVIIDRRSRVGLNRIVIPLPNFKFLQRLTRKKSENVENDSKRRSGPCFNMLYLDDEMRVHKTGDGNYFVQTRLYDVWDPMIGWTLISAV